MQSTNSAQGRDEPQDFLLKLLSLRQKVLFISKEEGAGAQYDKKTSGTCVPAYLVFRAA